MWAVYEKGKKLYCLSLYVFPMQGFSLVLEGKVHKDSKLAIMTNVGKSRLVKVILSNIHKISDVCANSFARYIMNAQGMGDVFTFY